MRSSVNGKIDFNKTIGAFSNYTGAAIIGQVDIRSHALSPTVAGNSSLRGGSLY
jgi:hypothetical protein